MDTIENKNTPAEGKETEATQTSKVAAGSSPSPRFKIVPKIKPLPSQVAAAKKAAEEAAKDAKDAETAGAAARPNGKLIRAENEDDDGYDPYSDFHDTPQREPLFQKDPWA